MVRVRLEANRLIVHWEGDYTSLLFAPSAENAAVRRALDGNGDPIAIEIEDIRSLDSLDIVIERYTPDSDYLTVREAADELGVTVARVRQFCQRGRIKGARKEEHGRWLIPKPFAFRPAKRGPVGIAGRPKR